MSEKTTRLRLPAEAALANAMQGKSLRRMLSDIAASGFAPHPFNDDDPPAEYVRSNGRPGRPALAKTRFPCVLRGNARTADLLEITERAQQFRKLCNGGKPISRARAVRWWLRGWLRWGQEA